MHPTESPTRSPTKDFNRDRTVHDSFHNAGYDPEEEYFYRVNRELLEANRAALDQQRRERAALEAAQVHWMHCPKCGGDLAEIESYGVKSDRCTSCGGAFFDKAELELMMRTLPKESASFTARLKKLLDAATRPHDASWTQIPI
jgi:Zn-finger nucleic acid-binding protein